MKIGPEWAIIGDIKRERYSIENPEKDNAMARKVEPHQVIARNFDSLTRCVRNLLIDNRNFKIQRDPETRRETQAHYFREYPKTPDFVRDVLASQAEAILERIDELKTLAVDYSNIQEFSLEELEAEIARRKALPAQVAA
jgi:hypothetical protein